jgi:hypothetical protein
MEEQLEILAAVAERFEEMESEGEQGTEELLEMIAEETDQDIGDVKELYCLLVSKDN